MVNTAARSTEGVLYQTELRPNRSSTPEAIQKLTLILSLALIPAGMIFVHVGAWPVFGFLGLELGALVVLLNYHHKRSYIIERIAITADGVRVERIDSSGRSYEWCFQRHWLQVNVKEDDDRNSTLELRSHGRVLAIGAFLTPSERHKVARRLRAALHATAQPYQA